jgi:hypothetical protein
MSKLVELLRGGDSRPLKGVTRVVDDVLHDPARFDELMQAMAHDDGVVRMRAADAAEKISRTDAECLQPFKSTLLLAAAMAEQPSLRWHLAQIVPRLRLDAAERKNAVAIFRRYLGDSSAIVKTCAMQGLADLALADASLRTSIVPVLRKATETGTAAMRARGTKLLEALRRHGKSD